jgi:hypothetical protein
MSTRAGAVCGGDGGGKVRIGNVGLLLVRVETVGLFLVTLLDDGQADGLFPQKNIMYCCVWPKSY